MKKNIVKQKSPYKLVEMDLDVGNKIIDSKGWDFMCENRYGTCYWNRFNGEVMWLDEAENMAKYSKLKA